MFHKAKSNKTDFLCPTCNSVQKEIKKEEDVKNLIKNFNLLRIVEKIEQRMSSSHSISKCLQESNTNLSQFNSTLENYDISFEQKCKKHNMKAYLHAIGTNMLLCEICVKETNLKAYPLPSV